MENISLEDLRNKRDHFQKMYDELIEASIDYEGKMQSRYDTRKEEYAAQAVLVGETIKKIDRQIAQIIELSKDGDGEIISIGSRVKIEIGDDEPLDALLISDAGGGEVSGLTLISSDSPIGKGLLGKRVNDTVIIEAPGGRFSVKILEILK